MKMVRLETHDDTELLVNVDLVAYVRGDGEDTCAVAFSVLKPKGNEIHGTASLYEVEVKGSLN